MWSGGAIMWVVVGVFPTKRDVYHTMAWQEPPKPVQLVEDPGGMAGTFWPDVWKVCLCGGGVTPPTQKVVCLSRLCRNSGRITSGGLLGDQSKFLGNTVTPLVYTSSHTTAGRYQVCLSCGSTTHRLNYGGAVCTVEITLFINDVVHLHNNMGRLIYKWGVMLNVTTHL